MNAVERDCYRFFDAAVGVACDVPGARHWLDEFFSPAFDVRSTAKAGFSMAITSAAYEAADLLGHPDAMSVACFAQDQKVTYRRLTSASGEQLVEDPKHGVIWRLSGKHVTVHVDPQRARMEGMRVVRELVVSAALADPARIQLHAAALETGGQAVLVAGPKGVGKTTLLAYITTATGAGILANDRVVLQQDGDGVAVRGVPTIVSVRPETLRLLSCSFAGIPRIERPVALTLAEAAAAQVQVGGVDGTVRLRLSPAQFAQELGAPLAATACLSAILFPHAHADPDGVDVERLLPAQAETALLAARFGLPSGKVGPTIFEQMVGCARVPGNDEAWLTRLAGSIPCFSVSLGARAFFDARAARVVLSACRGA